MMFFKNKKNKALSKKSWKIKRSCLDLIIESSKSIYPREFGGFLRVDEEKKDIISEVVLIPGTISGDSHAIFKLHMMPVDFNIVGTVHSHPGPNPNPSSADMQLFRKHGKIHIIMANPYNLSSWKAFDYNGYETKIEIC
jgi:proteasome lid subunit RPN8/RPN11